MTKEDLTREDLLRQIRRLSKEDQKILIWTLVGTNLRPWTEAQEIAYLLDVLVCPEGHAGAFSHFYLEGLTHLVVEDDGEIVPREDRFDKSEHFDVDMSIEGFYCEKCGEMKLNGNFCVPTRVVDYLFER